ncbi:PRC-barrel domain containing protein [Mesorhizobium sp. B2-5-4]|uniref:PRC-barrel domain-containing protein n=1 Tax=unclassified Mesorhizobium TaxID=325217 RepID=UPI00112B29D3|nr:MULTISPECIES: PRC-barrel domain-containing protein [unclassified Mesorhizobium]TPJ88078.1 PRC-barrel domain containing protein [Mesorhizobium sp. B2-5-13]TPK44805.1 PRC-barrel domain containing protein [Mesorhizobium sp. B2-5-4]TPK52273.1 PRC-barrel domain containing protein [Mesorhizobium sp. B2-5-5]TPL94279.1 PRC-barrel domain containing protein [Mesorhizobium sp. B2-3-11]
MMRKILTTIATAALMSTAFCTAGAQAANTSKPATQTEAVAPVIDGKLVSKIMGAAVYDSSADDATKIGDVNDIVLDKDGNAKLVVIGVGGFLGVGEKNVAYDFNKLEWINKKGDRWLVAKTTKDELKAQPNFDTKAYNTAAIPTAQPTNSMADSQAANGKTDTTATASIDKSTLTEMPSDKISAANLIGTNVYGADDAKVGEIGDVILTGDKKVDSIIVDVGGFLGIGEKEVAVGMENLKFMTDKNGNRYLYTNFTKDQLEAQTAYDKATYAQNRDKQRIIVNK